MHFARSVLNRKML